MQLAQLIDAPVLQPRLDIRGLTADSRTVQPGYLFAALPGAREDGARFIPEAVHRGAAVILCRPEVAENAGALGVVWLAEDNPRRRLALMAARFFAKQPETVVAVTGTNGKTSVADFVRQIWIRLGKSAASLGTLGVITAEDRQPLRHTTPDPITLHETLAGLAERGVTHLACEASSHGLAQHRLDGVRLSGGALTNITRDHLDYHASFDDYRYAKLRLFGEVIPPRGLVVINVDSEVAGDAINLSRARGHRIIRVGESGGELHLVRCSPHGGGQCLEIDFDRRRWSVALPLAGTFQASNALMAAALVIGCGAAPEAVFAALEHLQSVPGRLDCVAHRGNGAAVYVDYAHTPDALAHVLTALRPHTRGRLSVVFGCGGDRDRGKRPQMGAVAAALADYIIVTDDNPRSEEPASIRAAILAACPRAQEVADRRAAIHAGIGDLGPEDVLVVAGKGHESGQIIGKRTLPFDDRDVVRHAVAELEARVE